MKVENEVMGQDGTNSQRQAENVTIEWSDCLGIDRTTQDMM